ncbi:MAG: hypothetical protein Q9170_000867 [Blastenia crenularia]
MAQAVDHSNLEVGGNPKDAYSTLQVNNQPDQYSTLQVGRRPESYSGLQVDKPDVSHWDTKKELTTHYNTDPEKVDDHVPAPPYTPKGDRRICGLSRKMFWIILVLSLVAFAAIIGGIIGGTVGKHGKKKSKAVNGSSPANTPDVPSASQLLASTTLTTAAWNDTAGVLQQRLYVQGKDNDIFELSWTSTTNEWHTSNQSIAQAKPGSPLAAAVAYKGRTNQLNLYFINNNGELTQMNTTDYSHWDTTPVKTSNGTTAMPANGTSLAATWYKYTVCSDCSYNSFVSYQDTDHKYQIVNASTSGDVQYTTLPANPVANSGSTFNLQWRSTVQANIRLMYQLDGGQIASTYWNGTIATWHASESESATSLYSITAPSAPMTSFNLGRGAPSDVPDFLFVLAAGKNGVSVDCWDNSDPDRTHWRTAQSPTALQNVRSLSPIAANGAGHVFAFEGSVIKEYTVAADGQTWRVVGDVTKA